MSEAAAEVTVARDWRTPPLDGPQERLLAYIQERAVDGVLRAPIRVIGSAISIPTGSVPAAMTALEKKGWVARVYETGRKAATGYRLVGADHPRAKLELVAVQKNAWRGGAKVASRNSTLSRHGSVEPDPGAVRDLRADHPALVQERTIYPTTVKSVWETERLLVSGHNNPKLGAEVQKGPWAGMPIYHLTLEERASCPRSCALWAGCLTPDARILTADLRWVAQEDLAVGDRIVGFDEHASPVSKARCTKVATVEALERIVQPCFRVMTDRGNIITASVGHQWLAKSDRSGYRWVSTADLRVGDEMQYFGDPWEQDLSYGAGRVRGFVEGEGTCGVSGNNGFPKARVSWFQRPGKLLDEINALVEARGFQVSTHERIAGVNDSAVMHVDLLGGWREVARFLGVFRPTRMIEKAAEIIDGHTTTGRNFGRTWVVSIEPVGEAEVVMIKTSTNTMVAQGVFTHNCYGNAMHLARRHDHRDPLFLTFLESELWMLARQHQNGFVVRLHTLGDFYSLDYVRFWAMALDWIPQLRAFGYTANRPDSEDQTEREIGAAIQALTDAAWNVFAIRFSGRAQPQGSVVLDEAADEGSGIIMCPAQSESTTACATCGVCWAGAARDKTIGFLRHGKKARS